MKLLHGKTVIFVTHQVEFLPAADHILVRAVVILLALVRNPFICSLYVECLSSPHSIISINALSRRMLIYLFNTL